MRCLMIIKFVPRKEHFLALWIWADELFFFVVHRYNDQTFFFFLHRSCQDFIYCKLVFLRLCLFVLFPFVFFVFAATTRYLPNECFAPFWCV